MDTLTECRALEEQYPHAAALVAAIPSQAAHYADLYATRAGDARRQGWSLLAAILARMAADLGAPTRTH